MNNLKDLYFLNLTKEVSNLSRCLSRQVGTIIVKDGCIISTGYNGPARKVKHCNERDTRFYSILENNEIPIDFNERINICPRKVFGYKSGEGLEMCQAAHAEQNAIVQCARMGISTKDATLFCSLNPCKNCVVSIINAGIRRVVYPKPEKHYDEYAQVLLKEAEIEVCEMEV